MTEDRRERAEVEELLASSRDDLGRVLAKCPTGEELLDAVDDPDGLPPEVALHVERCEECRRVVETLREPVEETPSGTWAAVDERLENRPAPWGGSAGGRRWLPQALALAAAVLAAVGGGVLLLAPEETPAPVESGLRGDLLVAEAPVGRVDGPPVFRWTTTPLAAAYRLEVRESDADEVLLAVEVPGPPYRPGPEARERLWSSRELRWRVTALGPGGSELGSSAWADLVIGSR